MHDSIPASPSVLVPGTSWYIGEVAVTSVTLSQYEGRVSIFENSARKQVRKWTASPVNLEKWNNHELVDPVPVDPKKKLTFRFAIVGEGARVNGVPVPSADKYQFHIDAYVDMSARIAVSEYLNAHRLKLPRLYSAAKKNVPKVVAPRSAPSPHPESVEPEMVVTSPSSRATGGLQDDETSVHTGESSLQETRRPIGMSVTELALRRILGGKSPVDDTSDPQPLVPPATSPAIAQAAPAASKDKVLGPKPEILPQAVKPKKEKRIKVVSPFTPEVMIGRIQELLGVSPADFTNSKVRGLATKARQFASFVLRVDWRVPIKVVMNLTGANSASALYRTQEAGEKLLSEEFGELGERLRALREEFKGGQSAGHAVFALGQKPTPAAKIPSDPVSPTVTDDPVELATSIVIFAAANSGVFVIPDVAKCFEMEAADVCILVARMEERLKRDSDSRLSCFVEKMKRFLALKG
ncbi:MAG: hypothetical protein V4481_00770 [Patescibacteria group bacterium]